MPNQCTYCFHVNLTDYFFFVCGKSLAFLLTSCECLILHAWSILLISLGIVCMVCKPVCFLTPTCLFFLYLIKRFWTFTLPILPLSESFWVLWFLSCCRSLESNLKCGEQYTKCINVKFEASVMMWSWWSPLLALVTA